MSLSTPARPRSAPWRAPAAVAAVAVLLALAVAIPARALPGMAPSAATTVTGPQLTLTGTNETFTLQPDVPAFWQIGVTTHAVQVTTLLAAVTASGSLATTPAGASPTTLSLAACSQPWQGRTCPGAARQIVPATPLDALTGAARSLANGALVPASTYLLATVLMPSSGTQPGEQADVSVQVTAAGADLTPPPSGSQPGGVAPGRPTGPGGSLAQTGTRLGFSAVLAVAAIATGWFLAALARRRRDREARTG